MTMPKGAPPRTLPIGNITRDGYGHAQECPVQADTAAAAQP